MEDLRRQCTRFVHGHGIRSTAEQLGAIADDAAHDHYGEGGVVAELEAEVSDLLGTEAAVFMPSGTMAQQIALRIHADRGRSRVVGFHPLSHIDTHEEDAFRRLHQLEGRRIGEAHRLIGIDDLKAVDEHLAVLLIELPQRDLGGMLPTVDELAAQVEWAKSHGTALHLDGARLWQCPPYYDEPLKAIAARFDTVYVSFYKDLGALAGCALAGPADVISEAVLWRRRHGGTLFSMWPNAASALYALRARLPRMARYRSHAQAIAETLAGVPGVRVVPQTPHTSMFHLILDVSSETLEKRARAIAIDDKVWTWRTGMASDDPERSRVELAVGDATLEFEASEVRDVIRRLIT